MLDPSGDKEVKAELDQYKKRISENLQQDINYREMSDEQRERMVGPPELISLHDALATIQNPRMHLMEIHKTIGQLIYQLEEMHGQIESGAEQEKNGEGGDEDQVLSGVRFYQVRRVPRNNLNCRTQNVTYRTLTLVLSRVRHLSNSSNGGVSFTNAYTMLKKTSLTSLVYPTCTTMSGTYQANRMCRLYYLG